MEHPKEEQKLRGPKVLFILSLSLLFLQFIPLFICVNFSILGRYELARAKGRTEVARAKGRAEISRAKGRAEILRAKGN